MDQIPLNSILSVQSVQQMMHLQQQMQLQHQHQLHQQQQQQQRQPQPQPTHQQQPQQQKQLIDIVRCLLCKGFIIDAVTIDLCMHSFCKTCAVHYIREKHKCPECNLQIKDKRFLNRLKADVLIQNIVYKLNSGLYENEMARRRKFYNARPSPTPRYKSEMFGDIPPSKTIRPDDMLNVCIQAIEDEPIKTYLYCRADSTILVLREFIIRKFGLERPIKIYYGNSKLNFDFDTLMDVAANYNWSPEGKILNLSFEEENDNKNTTI